MTSDPRVFAAMGCVSAARERVLIARQGVSRAEADLAKLILPPMPPMQDGEGPDSYTDRLTGADGKNQRPYAEHRNRQCSIGWHGECSDPEGELCKCPCHQHQEARALLFEDYDDDE